MERFTTHQDGMSLVISLVMLIAILILSISLANLALQGEKATRNDRDRQVAFSAAEAALKDAEMDIDSQSQSQSPITRSQIFDAASNLFFEEGCGKGDGNKYQGLCLPAGSGQIPVWLNIDMGSDRSDSSSVKFGRFTGQTFVTGKALFPSKLPRYIIEVLPDIEAGQRADDQTKYIFRITAIGFGVSTKTQVVLQSFYRKAAKST